MTVVVKKNQKGMIKKPKGWPIASKHWHFIHKLRQITES